MSLSRKEFLTQGIFSLGKMLLPTCKEQDHSEHHWVIRPPGFIPAKAAACGTCEQCRTACPAGVITRATGIDGPVMAFGSSGCRFCYLCIGTCPNGVLTFPAEGEHPRLGVARLGDGCLAGGGCFTCSERCPQGAIEIAWGSGVLIEPGRCVGCGTCESSCPVRPAAIRVETVS